VIRSELDVLLDKVQDDALRTDLRAQTDRLQQRRSFGLVFEQHIPERVRLPQDPIRVGSHVVSRDDDGSPTWEVVAMDRGVATLAQVRDRGGAYLPRGEHAVAGQAQAPVDSLVVITDFGEPVLPGFRHLGSIERGGDKPYHVVIKGENHHALEALQFTHAGKVDCIYIDPPYNSGARDWKYNNDYVDENDAYRHSKWLAFMERRLKLAKDLLNPERSSLIVTVDENEVHRLGLLLDQTFAGVRTQMVSSVINPAGTGRQNELSRTNEYIFLLQFGGLVIQPMRAITNDAVPVEWEPFRRRDLQSRRGTAKGGRAQFFPVYVDRESRRIVGTGEPLPADQDRRTAPDRPGCATIFPVREDGTEMNWALTREEFQRRLEKGYVRLGRHQPSGHQDYVVSYLRTGPIADVEEGRAIVSGRNADGSVIAHYPAGKRRMPLTQWDYASHDAQRYGTTLLQSLTPGRRFPFPKSLYAVEDTLRIAIGELPNAVVLDFFAGSGTTAHAVARLNKQDGGRRQSILVTNNEVSAEEANDLRRRGLRPGDPEWEALGIFEHITRPRVIAAITGRTPDGDPIAGDYKFTDEFPMADGFDENVAFLDLRYLNADDVDLGLAFDNIAPLLWLRAGGQGPIARHRDDEGNPLPYAWTDWHGVLFDEDSWRSFVAARPESARAAFIVTYSPATFSGVATELPGIDLVRLYDTYLSMFLPQRIGV
jgi:adenine-specific DNA-methyltransferase